MTSSKKLVTSKNWTIPTEETTGLYFLSPSCPTSQLAPQSRAWHHELTGWTCMVALEAKTEEFARSSIPAWLQCEFQVSLGYRVKPCLNKTKENKSAFINLQQAHLAKSESPTTWQYLKEQNSVYPAIIAAKQPFPEKGKWRTNVDWLLMGGKKKKQAFTRESLLQM